MTRADKLMCRMILEIFEDGYKDENPRPKYADGTPAHTYSVNHIFRSYDLSEGDFPICTLRPQAWKTGIKEIFTIYQYPTNNIEEMCERAYKNW
jgi:thymidylate synthase